MNVSKITNKIKNIKITGRGIYFFSFIMYFVISFLRTSTYTEVVSSNQLVRITYLIALLLIFKVYFFDQQTVKSFLINSLVILIGVVIWRSTHAIDIFLYMLFVISARDINYHALIEFYLKIGILMLVFMVISSGLGIIKDLVFIRNGVRRHSLGILYPTDFAAHAFFLVLAYCYVYFRKLDWKAYLSFILLAVFLTVETQARLDIISILLTIPVIWIAKRASEGKVFSKFMASFYWMIAPILAYITVLAAYFYNHSKPYIFADKIVSGRLALSHTAFQKYGVSVFGNLVQEHGFGGNAGSKVFYQSGMGGKYFFIDSSFMRLMIIYGVIAFVAVIAVMTIIGLKSVLTSDYRLAAIMVMLAISCVIEQHLLDMSYDPFLIALFASEITGHDRHENHDLATLEV